MIKANEQDTKYGILGLVMIMMMMMMMTYKIYIDGDDDDDPFCLLEAFQEKWSPIKLLPGETKLLDLHFMICCKMVGGGDDDFL